MISKSFSHVQYEGGRPSKVPDNPESSFTPLVVLVAPQKVFSWIKLVFSFFSILSIEPLKGVTSWKECYPTFCVSVF